MGRILRDQRVVQHEMVDPRGQEADDGIARRLHDRLFWLRRHWFNVSEVRIISVRNDH
jgi:hypothetical protein